MKFILKYWELIMAGIVIVLFCWLRFNFIKTSFDFSGDPGRDMLTLWDWRESGKPPLLGPQTSAMPLNQSAVYFYMLYPAFLLMNGNPVSANVTVAVFWVASLIIGLWALRKRKDLQWLILLVFALSSIHPIFVSQTRSVWNPSFLPPLITASFVSLLLLKEGVSNINLIIFSVSTAWAVSLHFPIGAFALASLIYIWIFFKEKRVLITCAFIAMMFLFNLPTLLFEMRHGFLILGNVIEGKWIGTEQFSRLDNLKMMMSFIAGLSKEDIGILAFLAFMVFPVKTIFEKGQSISKIVSIVLIISIALTILSKMAFHSHYVFGFAICVFIFISQLPRKILWPLLLLLEIIWLNPKQTDIYFSPARRSVEEMSSCFKDVCSAEKEPLFVSVQSAFNPFHVGYEYRYLLKKEGCDVKYIESQPETAKRMAIVLDGSSYVHGETGYNELTLFGKASVSTKYECGRGFGVVMLDKLN